MSSRLSFRGVRLVGVTSRLACSLACLAALGLLVAVQAVAMPAGQGTQPVNWHLRWTKFASPQDGAVQDGPWVFVVENASTGEGVVVNVDSGTSTDIAPPAQDCSYSGRVLAGGGWLLFGCTNGTNKAGHPTVEELYSFTTGTWRTFDSSVAANHGFGMPYEIGSHWIGFLGLFGYRQNEELGGWENLSTHAWKETGANEQRIPGLGPTTMLDINSPTLLTPVCFPLRLPFGGRLIGSSQGLRSPIRMFGPFAMIGNPYAGGSYHPSYGSSTYTYVERCGQQKRRTLSELQSLSAVSNGVVLIWDPDKSRLGGMYLNSGQRFVSGLGTPAQFGPALGITPHRVIQFSDSGLWDAALPRGA